MHVLPAGALRSDVHLLRCDLSAYQATEEDIHPILDRHLAKRWLEEARSLRFGETLSFRYRVQLRETSTMEALLREISALDGVERVMVIHGEEGGGD
jgi:hypothetical protein